MSDIEVSLDSRKVVEGTKKAVSALDKLVEAFDNLQKNSDVSASQLDDAWQKTVSKLSAVNKKLGGIYTSFAKSAKEGTLEYSKIISAETETIQKLYESRIATEIALGNEELAFWKSQGAKLGALRANQLKMFEDTNKSRIASATPMSLDETRMLLGMPTTAQAKAASDAIKLQMIESQKQFEATAKAVARSATPMSMDETRMLLGLPPREEMRNFAAQLKAQMSADLSKEKLKASTASSMGMEETRKLLGLPSRAEMSSFAKQLRTDMQEFSKVQAAATKAQIPLDTVSGAFTPYNAIGVQAAELRRINRGLTDDNDKLGTSFRKLAIDGNDVHSMARGLASGFNALWLTWGNLAPLFIGAAISNGFMQTVKSGMEVANTLKTIEVLGGNSAEEMSALTAELDRIGKTGPVGPIQVAEAMKVLSLAGLKANEIVSVTKDVLNFSIAGNTGIEKAASTLMAVSTAFSMGTEGFGQVADIISKASAVSMTSVEKFSEAMKTASVINAQFGVSLKDTAVAIAAMSQLGIEGTAAGTALRNAYADLSGRTEQVAKVMRMQGIAVRDAAGNFKPLIGIVAELNTKLSQMKDEGAKQRLTQAILSERGAKGIIELLRLIQTEAKNAGSGMSNALEELRAAIDDSAGFSDISASKLKQTTQKQFEAVKATLVSTMVEVYREVDPILVIIADKLKTVFASSEFKDALTTLVVGVADFTITLAENIKVIGYAAAVYATLKLAQVAMIGYSGLANAASLLFARTINAETIAIGLNTTAKEINAARSAGFLASAGLLARAIPGIGTALTIATSAYMLFDWWMSKSNNSAERASEIYNGNIVKDLNDQADKLEKINKLRSEGLTKQEAEYRLTYLKEKGMDVNAAAKLRQEAEDALQNTALTLETRNAIFAAKMQAAHNLETSAKEASSEVDKAQARLKAAKEYEAAADEAARKAAAKTPTGTAGFDKRDLTSGGTQDAFLSTLKTLKSETASLRAEQDAGTSQTTEWTTIQRAAAKELEGLTETYKNSTKAVKDLSPNQLAKINADYAEAKSVVEVNRNLKAQNLERKEVEAYTLKQLEIEQQLINSKNAFKSAQANKYNLPVQREAAAAALKIDQDYNEAVRKAEIATQAKLDEARGDPQRILQVLQARKTLMADLASNKTDTAAQEQTKIYQNAWDSTISSISSNFLSAMMGNTMSLKDFMVKSFADTVLMPQLNLLVSQGFNALLGGGPSSIFGSMFGLKSFEGGGSTGSGSRSGGMDGKGGYLAMVHPNETVVDHSSGQSLGGQPIYITISNTVGDVATKSMLDQANAATVKQIQAGLGRSMKYNGVMSRG